MTDPQRFKKVLGFVKPVFVRAHYLSVPLAR
jgi:hypothetical protein